MKEAKKFLTRYLVSVFHILYHMLILYAERGPQLSSSPGKKRGELVCGYVCVCVHILLLLLQDIDTSLIKLLAEERSKSLIGYLSNHDLHLDLEDTRQTLERHKV